MATETINWKPLEDLIGKEKAGHFMYMGTGDAGRIVVYLYKHSDTRRYLNIDAAGNTYKYYPNQHPAYDTIGKEEAIQVAFS